MDTKTALVLGATGGVGGETARALLRHGWRVRALARRMPADQEGIDWRQGDALDRDTVIAAAQGCDVIVHAVNPPGYSNWATDGVAMLDNSIAAAQASGARIAMPGNVYGYDWRRVRLADERTPQRPICRKGAIRKAMEDKLEASGVAVLILRAGDFFGPRPGGSWLSDGMISKGKPIRSIMVPASRGAGHSWAYLPDVAETFARLLDRREELPRFARFHFGGVWDGDGRVIADAIRRAAGDANISTRAFPWWLVPLIAPFNTMFREMAEMRGLWSHTLRLDNRALIAFLGAEPHTPLDEAMRTTLAALGCTQPVAGKSGAVRLYPANADSFRAAHAHSGAY